jgi:ribosomal protein L37AE/L43A
VVTLSPSQNVDNSDIKFQQCPNCQTRVPSHDEYRTWCQKCNWNLQAPSEEIKPETALEKLQLELSQKYSQELFSEVNQAIPNTLKPTLTTTKLLALVVATGVYALAGLFLLTGSLLLINFYR